MSILIETCRESREDDDFIDIEFSLSGADFKVYIPRLLPHALKVLSNDASPDEVTQKLLDTLVVLGCTLEEYLHLLIPPLVRLFEKPGDNESFRRNVIQTVDRLADELDVSQFSSMIVHGLIRTIDSNCGEELKDVSSSKIGFRN